MRHAVRAFVPLFLSTILALDASAQRAALTGSVLADSTEKPLAGAEVAIPTLKLSTRTNAAGEFFLVNIYPGTYIVVARQIGYRPIFVSLTFADSGTVETDFLLLRRVVVLDTITAAENAPAAKMRGFEERRALGLGHYITRDELEKRENSRMADILAQVPGVRIVRARTSGSGFVANSRGRNSIAPERSGNRRLGIPAACYATVYLDGVPVYTGRDNSSLFDVNSFGPMQLEGVEYYSSAAQTPTQYAGTGTDCGVLLLWTRISK
jgi:hypothetical protein